jgi:cell wall-associated NlpC family hydrolase
MTESLDPFLHPVRDDLAGEELKGVVERPRFAAARPAQVAVGTLDLRRAPANDAPLDTQLFQADGYVGYAGAAALRDEIETASHWVRVPRTFVFPTPDEKRPPLDALAMTARVRVLSQEGRYSEVAWGAETGWVPSGHLLPVGETVEDFVSTALAFIGVPYLLGGRTSLGLDCSGLVQVALAAAGIACLRDSYMQEASLGQPRPLDEPPVRGDLLFMAGHVAIALDAWRVLHANAHDMTTAIEPLDELVARVRARDGQGLSAIRRPRALSLD